MTDKLTTAIDQLGHLIAFPSISADGNRPLINYLADIFESHGARLTLQEADGGKKANLFATIGPEGGKDGMEGGILLSGHSDVVPVQGQPWSHDPFQMHQEDGRLYGRGSCDMKGFIACLLAMLPRFCETKRRVPLHFAFTYDEEVGCLGAKSLTALLQEKNIRPRLAIIGEPTQMKVIDAHKSVCDYTTCFHGRAGHSSLPDQGVSAIDYAVKYATRLMELSTALKDRAPPTSPFTPAWTSINIGAMRGGLAHNVIADKAELDWQMRPIQAKDKGFVLQDLDNYVQNELLPAMRAIAPEANIERKALADVIGLEPAEHNSARDLCLALTGQNKSHAVSFGTEAGIFKQLGCDIVICGPGSIDQAHKADEFVEIDQLAQCLSFLEKLNETV